MSDVSIKWHGQKASDLVKELRLTAPILEPSAEENEGSSSPDPAPADPGAA